MTQQVADYLSWFQLNEPPFRLSPDLDFFFPSRSHKQALEILNYGIARGEGFMVLTGHAGTGKTMLLRLLLKELPPEKQAAFIVTPAVSPKGLMSLLLEELNTKLSHERLELGLLLKDFQDHLLALAEKGKSLLVVVDEAQDLPLETIEQLRLLSNIETGKRKLIQILLVGQPELEQLLADPGLCQLTQRIVIKETLKPLDRDEPKDYIKFRLSRAGRPDLDISSDFLFRLFKKSKGLPRLINRAMDRALLMAAASGSKGLERRHLSDALDTLPEPGEQQRPAHCSSFFLNKRLGRNLVMAVMSSAAGAAICLLLLNGGMLPLFRTQPPLQAPDSRETVVQQARKRSPVRVSVKSARIHARPLKGSEILTIAKQGKLLFVLQEKGRWYKVYGEEAGGVQIAGWLLKKQVDRSLSAANTVKKEAVDYSRGRQRHI